MRLVKKLMIRALKCCHTSSSPKKDKYYYNSVVFCFQKTISNSLYSAFYNVNSFFNFFSFFYTYLFKPTRLLKKKKIDISQFKNLCYDRATKPKCNQLKHIARQMTKFTDWLVEPFSACFISFFRWAECFTK